MKLMMLFAALLFFAGTVSAAEWGKYMRSEEVPTSALDRASYSIGMSLGQDFKTRGMEMNPDLIAQGIHDVLAGNEPLLSQEEALAALQKLQEMALAKQQEVMDGMAATNLAEGTAFLEENGKRSGVVTTDSGLQYEVLVEGNGASPKKTDNVSVDYRGMFIDGTEFDSSYKRGEPANFSVEGIIPGWTEALQMMKEGGKWKLFVPADLAYGTRGAPPVIEPNKTLIFEVELKEILEQD
ncbi:MAG: hypothetical protein C0623_10185 [Desulfuromonas sp.]|nr:MAG: hypothetical protein C0623_10185 [Desulfuromonas sp.]